MFTLTATLGVRPLTATFATMADALSALRVVLPGTPSVIPGPSGSVTATAGALTATIRESR